MKERKKTPSLMYKRHTGSDHQMKQMRLGDRDFDVLWGLHEAEDAGLLLKIETGRQGTQSISSQSYIADYVN